MTEPSSPGNRRVLVLSPHPDDESIGCGGAVRIHVERGDEVHVIFLTSGEKGGHGRSAVDTVAIREAESHAAAKLLGIHRIDFWREPDGSLQSHPELVGRLRDAITTWTPHVIYSPHEAEQHPDHRATVDLLRKALSAANSCRPRVLLYEVWTPLQLMDEIVDISPWIERKMAAIQTYRSQCDVLQFDEAIRGLNRYRGEMHCWPEGEYAEVFQELRW